MSEAKKNIPSDGKDIDVVKSITTVKPPEVMVYVGPTIRGVANWCQVFNNGLSNELQDVMEKNPAFKGLVVPISKLSIAVSEIEGRSGATYVLYNKVLTNEI